MSIVTIRASALGDFLDCPARAEAKHLRGLRTPSGGNAVLGTAPRPSSRNPSFNVRRSTSSSSPTAGYDSR